MSLLSQLASSQENEREQESGGSTECTEAVCKINDLRITLLFAAIILIMLITSFEPNLLYKPENWQALLVYSKVMPCRYSNKMTHRLTL